MSSAKGSNALVISLLLFWIVSPAPAQSPAFTIQVGDKPALTITTEDFGKLARRTVVATEHNVKISYEGVLLHDVLLRAGAPLGEQLRGKALSSYVLAKARDGYEVVYTLAELDPAFTGSEILIADKADGKPLNEKQGPFRIVVPHEKKPARSLRMLERIEVVQLSK